MRSEISDRRGSSWVSHRRTARTAWSIYTYKTEFDPARLTNPLT
jgi:hypothetical protein